MGSAFRVQARNTAGSEGSGSHEVRSQEREGDDAQGRRVENGHGRGSPPIGSHFGVGAPPILVYFSGDSGC